MDNVRERVIEHRRLSRKKVLLGFILIVMLIFAAVLIENWLAENPTPTDVVIKKDKISEGNALFVKVDALDTNIIAVKSEDGDDYKYSFVFDDCEGCYQQFGKHFSYHVNDDKTGIVCKNCGHGAAFEEMGFVAEDCHPVMIHPQDYIDNGDSFVFTSEYLKEKQTELENKRNGKAMMDPNQVSDN